MPIIVYKDTKELIKLSISIIDDVKRAILEVLSPVALPSSIIAEQLGIPAEIIQDFLKQLIQSGLVIEVGSDKNGQKYYSTLSPILPDIDVKELEPELNKLADNFYSEFLKSISKNQALLEEILERNDGRYTLGRIVEHACSNVIEQMQKKIQSEVIEENKRIIADIASSP